MEAKLPNGWIETDSCNLFDQHRGLNYKKHQAFSFKSEGDVLVLRGGNIQDGKITNSKDDVYVSKNLVKHTQLIREGDVIIVSSTGSKKLIGKAAHSETDDPTTTFGAFLTLLRPKSFINSKYFDYFYQTDFYRESIRELSGGININNIRKDHLAQIKFPLPPLTEQKRIVAKLDSIFGHLDELKTKLDRIPKLLKNFRQQVLTQAVTGKLTEEWREGKGLEWEIIPFGEIMEGTPKNGAYYPRSQYGSGTRIIRIDAFYDGYIKDWDSLQRVSIPDSDLQIYGIEIDDIIVNRVNSMDYLGKCMLVEELTEPTIYESNMMRIKLMKKKVLPKYARIFLISPVGTKEIRKNAKQAVNQASINQHDVKSIYFNLPELAEQEEIIRRVDGLVDYIKSIEYQYKSVKAKIENLPQAILNKAFKGELVPQDPNDEPASGLLKRIQKEKVGKK
ncbi:restriction endonuclease subunit S [Fulvivirgaceae bacterium LMO-SS25]